MEKQSVTVKSKEEKSEYWEDMSEETKSKIAPHTKESLKEYHEVMKAAEELVKKHPEKYGTWT